MPPADQIKSEKSLSLIQASRPMAALEVCACPVFKVLKACAVDLIYFVCKRSAVSLEPSAKEIISNNYHKFA